MHTCTHYLFSRFYISVHVDGLDYATHTMLMLCNTHAWCCVLSKPDWMQVGASISMTYQNGQPIVFVGTGQDYPDIKRLNVGAVVKSLLN